MDVFPKETSRYRFGFMASELIITNERVDDIPLLLTQLEHMGIEQLIDKHFPSHGNWQGLNLGSVVVIWLTHILSQADHRLNHVQAWVSQRLETLKRFTDESLRSLDLADDRLQAALRYLSMDANWFSFESEVCGSLLQVYDIVPEKVRLFSTTASSHCGVNPEGLFQWGHSKDHRLSLAQVKIMLSTLDPLGMPIATEILSGEKADDPLYIPAIEKVRSTLKKPGLLYIGDCKMSSIKTRTHIVLGGDFYLCPLTAKQISNPELIEYLQPVWDGQQELITINYDYADGETKEIAVGFEREIIHEIEVNGQEISWSERQLVVRSFAIQKTEEKYLRERIQKTVDALEKLKMPRRGKKKLTSHSEWSEGCEAILKRYKTSGLFQIDIQIQRVQKAQKRYRSRQTQIVEEVSF